MKRTRLKVLAAILLLFAFPLHVTDGFENRATIAMESR